MSEIHSGDIENGLKEALERNLKESLGGFSGDTPPNLEAAIRYSLLAPGKRIRPRLAITCARMLGLPLEAALPAAYAVEMIHCFTLIHDDLPCMDNDDFRRGQPSNHKVHGESIALLAGDALMSLAIDVYLEAMPHVKPERLFQGLKRLNWAIGPRGVIGGQAAEALLNSDSSLTQLRKMHAQKTGALFSASLLIPMDLAGISGDSEKGLAIDAFARELGLGFQVADDLEDALEDAVGNARQEGAQQEDANPAPTSILHFLPLAEAKRMTRQSLEAAALSLKTNWGAAANPLVQIADEVLRKL